MFQLKLGEKISHLKGVGDDIKFGMSDAGAELLIYFNRPSEKEIESIKSGKLQFGMFVKEGVIFILSKFEGMEWMDAPFHFGLANNLTDLQEISQGQGYGCNIIFVDSSTGKIKALRYISFSTEFSRKLKKNIQDQMLENFNVSEYDIKLARIMRNYTTKDMVNYSEVNCKIR